MERYLGTDDLPKSDVISFLQRHADAAFLRKWKLSGVPKSIRKNRNCPQLVEAYKVLKRHSYMDLNYLAIGELPGVSIGLIPDMCLLFILVVKTISFLNFL